MNIQKLTRNPAKFPVDVALIKRALLYVMTRNERDPAKRMLDRVQLEKNLESLNFAPEAHLGTTMQIMDSVTQRGEALGFEAGLMFGVTMTLSARSVNGKQMLTRMIHDIERQQAQSEDAPPTEAIADAVNMIAEEGGTPSVNPPGACL